MRFLIDTMSFAIFNWAFCYSSICAFRFIRRNYANDQCSKSRTAFLIKLLSYILQSFLCDAMICHFVMKRQSKRYRRLSRYLSIEYQQASNTAQQSVKRSFAKCDKMQSIEPENEGLVVKSSLDTAQSDLEMSSFDEIPIEHCALKIGKELLTTMSTWSRTIIYRTVLLKM
jgi:hypothetical protein